MLNHFTRIGGATLGALSAVDGVWRAWCLASNFRAAQFTIDASAGVAAERIGDTAFSAFVHHAPDFARHFTGVAGSRLTQPLSRAKAAGGFRAGSTLDIASATELVVESLSGLNLRDGFRVLCVHENGALTGEPSSNNFRTRIIREGIAGLR
jgi:hypothetical protein